MYHKFFTIKNVLSWVFVVALLMPVLTNAQTLAPFYHGVASGDPLSDRVIIWTRITPKEGSNAPVEVKWKIATDKALNNVINSGTFVTNADRDYTVKIDVDGLMPEKTYYYAFEAMDKSSIVGRTKTAPSGDTDHLRFAVVSCNNYQDGYFNAFARIAERKDLDAVIHLGDYIYEYSATGDDRFGRSALLNAGLRLHEPDNEIVTVEDYRTRYAQYRLDSNLRKAHQMHPFITIWDDHESTNNSYEDGAQNHQPDTEGEWEVRKSVSKQVYTEWMPIRGDLTEQVLYRTISYGNLMDLILLDTRLEGRDITDGAANDSIVNVAQPGLYEASRQMLGEEQENWFFDQLKKSTAKWKIIGNQIVFADFNIWWSNPADPVAGQDLFLDFWDGYPKAKERVINFIANNQIDNVVMITGDFHTSVASDIALFPAVLDGINENIPLTGVAPFPVTPNYDPVSGAGSVAVEFATPGISSQNFDEFFFEGGLDSASAVLTSLGFQFQTNNPFDSNAGPLAGINPNPHIKYVDLISQGYLVLDVRPERTQANWYYTPNVLDPNSGEFFGAAWGTNDGANHLTPGEESSEKSIITGFTLIDAQTDQAIPGFDPIPEGAVINLSTLAVERKFNIRANTKSDVGSVVFEVAKANGETVRNTENAAPYAAFNDNNGNYLSWRPVAPQAGDEFIVTATAYSMANAKGEAEEPTTLSFSFIDEGDAPEITELVLINADTDTEIGLLTDGQTINLSETGTTNLSVMAKTYPSPTGSVTFDLEGPLSHEQVENLLPYALFGDNPGKDFNGGTFEAGNYTLEAKPFNGNNALGISGDAIVVSFEVVNSTVNVTLKVLENPTDRKLIQVRSEDELGSGTMRVIDASGSVIKTIEINGKLDEKVEISYNGLHFVDIQTDKFNKMIRFMAY